MSVPQSNNFQSTMKKFIVYLRKFVKYLLTSEPMQPILDDDVLFRVLGIVIALLSNKFLRPLSFGVFGFLILQYILTLSFLAITDQWNLLLTQYAAVIAGALIILSFYATIYTSNHDYHKLYHSIFPKLWSLHSMGPTTFKNFKRRANRVLDGYKIAIVVCMLAATSGLPWYGDEYEIFLQVKILKDLLGKWNLPFTAFFYLSLYHVGVTILSTAAGIIYLVLHLHNQCILVKQRLESLNERVDVSDLSVVEDADYQNLVTCELTCCIQHHHTLLEFLDQINDFLYYKIFYFTGSGVLTIAAVILVPKTYALILRIVFIVVIAGVVTVAFCWLGQLTENESEKIFYSAVNTPWYLWNTKNRKFLQLLLQNSQQNMVLSSSGIITINFQLLIGLYQTVYSILTFVLNVSKTR